MKVLCYLTNSNISDPSRRSNDASDEETIEEGEDDGDSNHDDEGIEQDCHEDSMDHLRSLEPSPDNHHGVVNRRQAQRGHQPGSSARRSFMSEESEESEEESSSLESLRRIRELCEHHLSVGSEAEEHYRKVCRALVSESVELALFLEKAQKQEELHTEELVQLAQSDWVSL